MFDDPFSSETPLKSDPFGTTTMPVQK
jgi:ADP-ribosylation factor GTPase-activating protein 2/3